MAVAVKMTPETAPQQSLNRLAVGSLVGTVYVLVSLAIIYVVPVVWGELISPTLVSAIGPFVDGVLRVLLVLGVAALLVLFGWRLLGPTPAHGIRAGIFFGTVGVVLIGLFTCAIGAGLERNFGPNGGMVGLGLTAAVGLVLLIAGGMAYFRAGFERWLVQVEDQGWFSAAAYKRTQGQRVRRGTMVGFLILVGTGVYTLLTHGTLVNASTDWLLRIPFANGRSLILLPDVEFTVPLLLAALGIWCAYRIVNYPMFADFLIATEAELNKVSWTTRRRLFQDTMVVLVTMLLITGFLFVCDTIWIKSLSNRWVNVIQTGTVDTKDIDGQIQDLQREKQVAEEQKDTQKVKTIDSQIEKLSQERESLTRGKQGGSPQDW
jgi:preprotein translocase SecE subunit